MRGLDRWVRVGDLCAPQHNAEGDFIAPSQRRLIIYRPDPKSGIDLVWFSLPLPKCVLALKAKQHETNAPKPPNVYERFIEEFDALTIGSEQPAVAVVAELTRAVKRAQMVADGELATVATRKARAKAYADGLNTLLLEEP